MSVYKTLCIHAKCHLIIVYKVLCIISTNKQKHQLCACLITKLKVTNNPLGYLHVWKSKIFYNKYIKIPLHEFSIE
jgi:hypothetical protein